ncbi:trypsin-like serine protease [Sorangium sp. So ce887]|uniref:trypsin-like serine protease n=1 Tax=Sorangium sp. So ce887 TaxID=3133324 RepID=UPI003F616962
MNKSLEVIIVAASYSIAGCVLDAPNGTDTHLGAEHTNEHAEALTNGESPVADNSSLARSTVRVKTQTHPSWFPPGFDLVDYCTGVIVGPRHVLSASHCIPPAGDTTVTFYNGPLPTGDFATAIAAVAPSGVELGSYSDDGRRDTNGKFADIAILTLDSDIPSYTRPALLPLGYPGNDVSGYMVGIGYHDNQPNDDDWDMRKRSETTYSSDVNDGHFLVNDGHLLTDWPNVSHGDSGGPFLVGASTPGRYVVHGVAASAVDEWGTWKTKYTSIAYRLNWVLSKISYTGGMTRNVGVQLVSSSFIIDPSVDHSRKCALHCEHTPSCSSYSYSLTGQLCTLNLGSATPETASGFVSGEKP